MRKKLILAVLAALTLIFIISGCSGKTVASTAAATDLPSTPLQSSPSQATASTVSDTTAFTGYLIDQRCGLSGIDIQDGTNITKHPEKHTLSCALMPMCIASGYGLSVQQSDGTYKFYKFDQNGSAMAKSTVIDKTKKSDNMLVEVKGNMNGDTITVTTIMEK